MTTTPPTDAATTFASSARMLVGAIMSALVFFGIALSFALGTEATPPTWVPLAQLAAGIGVHFLVETIGYRAEPLDPGMSEGDAAVVARTRWQSSMMVRMALIEAIAILSLVAAFVIDAGVWTYVGGALVSLALMAIHVWPGSRSVSRTADALEARGQASFLRESFGLPPAGPIQQA
ncbi:hypothetical protein ACOCJ7_06085 [Knoellia sp. CPCC 206453]|uniref:hypothetical protein n=1 Tax=Knoellia pratensis TaxID=3404796 RepID=UPI003621C27F